MENGDVWGGSSGAAAERQRRNTSALSLLSVFSCAHWQGFRVDINEQFEALSFIIRFSSGFQFLSNLKKPLASIFYQLRLMSRLPISSPVNFVYSANIDFHVHITQLMTCWYVNDKRPVVVKVRHNGPVVQLLIYLQKHSACELLIRTGLFFFFSLVPVVSPSFYHMQSFASTIVLFVFSQHSFSAASRFVFHDSC